MAWNRKNHRQFPSHVERLLRDAGTLLCQRYLLEEAVEFSGAEVYYQAEDIQTGEEVLLSELLPLRWCILNREDCYTLRYPEQAASWERFLTAAKERLLRLRAIPAEEAPVQILDVFEEKGTLWYSMPFAETVPLQLTETYEPEQTIVMLTPLLDVLAGLHDAGVYHGAIKASSVRLEEDNCTLRDWTSCEQAAQAQEDVRAVSLLLYQMMTGEMLWQEQTAETLPISIRNALYNGIYDQDMTIAELWKQLHARKPVEKVQSVRYRKPPVLGKIFRPGLTFAVCAVCLVIPLAMWAAKGNFSLGLKKMQFVRYVLPDVPYAPYDDDVLVPEVLNLPETEATEKLKALGLEVYLKASEGNPVVPAGSILTQTPSAGAVIPEGKLVTLTVSSGWSKAVPDVSGWTLEKAQARLEALGFQVEQEEAVSENTAPGAVISQDIAPETELEQGSTVHLTVSVGRMDLDSSAKVSVPDCSGMTFTEARDLLAEQFLYTVLEETVFDTSVPAGQIASQSVQAGKEVPQGTTVHMAVSLGAEKTSVPDVQQMTANEAKTALAKANLKCVFCYTSSEEALDTVIGQNYEPNTILPIRTEVWLTVSVGTENHVDSLGGWSGQTLPSGDEVVSNPEQLPVTFEDGDELNPVEPEILPEEVSPDGELNPPPMPE